MRSLLGRFHRPMSRGLVNNMLTMNNLGDGSTLSLDFTTMGGVLDPRLTFTRASTVATYINSSGYVATATTNEPRFDYSPTNIGEPRGLLVEGQTQNALFYSQDVTQASRWTIQAFGSGSYTTVSTTGGTAPDNTNTANLLTEGTGSFSRSIYQAVSMAIGTHTASLFVKAGSGNARYIRLVLASAAGNFVYVTVNLANGAVTQTAAAVGTATAASAIVTSYTGGWYRISLTGTFTAATNFCFIVPSDSATPAVNTGDYGRYDYVGTGASFSLWGCQVEAGSGASSYIPTGASQVTRNADLCSMTGTNFSSWYTQGIGTVCWSGSAFRITAGHLANINTVNNDPRITAYVGAGALTNLVTNGTTQASMFFGSVTANTAFKAAWRFNTNDFAACLNAGTVYTDTAGTVPTGVDRMQLGAAEGGYQFLDGWIKSIKYYPTAFTNAELQTATTL